MRWPQVVASFVVTAAFVLLVVPGVASARTAPESFADLAERLSPAVVNISTTQTVERPTGDFVVPQFPPGSPFEDLFRDFLERGQGETMPRKVTSLGSGFVIDASGVIVTNNHVIEEADEITVKFPDGTELKAELVGRDPETDVAVLRVKPKSPLPALKFGDSDHARVGDWVLAIGNPFGLGGSVSAGIVSARNRDIQAGRFDDFIQTDAAINRGNSGGPLFNMDGDVVGVNSAIISPSGGSIGIGFAIPSRMVEPVVQQLLEYGETRRGWLGVRIQTVTDDMAEALSLDKAKGALVAGVNKDGPAETAGIAPGDVIVTFDGKTVPDMRALPRIVADTEIGKTVEVEVIRNGKKRTFRVKTGRFEEAQAMASLGGGDKSETPAPSSKTSLGLTLSPLTAEARERFGIADEVHGVLVIEVDPKGPAADTLIRAGDVIVEVAQEEVAAPEDVVAKVDKVSASQKKSVLLLVNKNGDPVFVTVPIQGS